VLEFGSVARLYETEASASDGGHRKKFVVYHGLNVSTSSEGLGPGLTEVNV